MSKTEQDIVTQEMIRGFLDQAKRAGTKVTGGQTVLNPAPIIGGVATAIVQDCIRPENAQDGDILVLTKPLGTQVAVNFFEQDPLAANEAYEKARLSMKTLNRRAAELMVKYNAHAATDITGFGILGHTQNLALHQKLKNLEFRLQQLPVFKGMLQIDARNPNLFKLAQGFSAETSGGLLISLPSEEAAQQFCAEKDSFLFGGPWIVGSVIQSSCSQSASTASLAPNLTWIEC
eukprot:CAMPEP_0197292374 /NCGR_PEP_ID=MMETSP0890-20130614/22759_1 /TAXON_ID=44058 ORGANISM="Aureoumbra lagunensis, Strain CCMP1510" /NCGR_SAMPLE_ID=MMETSP0890 /ASSEMBLY_ACC=CAM_ASM_000533 /LENGTH=232 /DNA_ID=CAMNT_0042766203 /DNA_START=411 /DNA_END=1109 /DNA_ORIENTATION=+